MSSSSQIASRQLVGLIILSRLFILLIYVPTSFQVAQGPASLVVMPLGCLFTLLAMLPAWYLMKQYQGRDLLGAVEVISPKLLKPAAFLFYLLCMSVTIETIAQFELFMTTAVYPNANQNYIILIFAAAVLYMAFMGIEAIARASFIVLLMVTVSAIIVSWGLVEFIELVNVFTPFYDGMKPIIAGTFRVFTQNIEIIAFVLMLPYLNKSKSESSFLWYILITTILFELVTFLGITVLGNYGKTRTYPVYTMSAISGSEFFYRLDYFHIINWICISMLRAVLYLFLSSRMLGFILSKWKNKKILYWINIVIVVILTLFTSRHIKLFGKLYQSITSGIPVTILVVLLPTILLYIQYFKMKRGTLPDCGNPPPDQTDGQTPGEGEQNA